MPNFLDSIFSDAMLGVREPVGKRQPQNRTGSKALKKKLNRQKKRAKKQRRKNRKR